VPGRIDLTQRFTLDETRAAAWLARAVTAHDADLRGDTGTPPPGEELPEITTGWEPRAYGEENTVYLLIRLAADAGVITAPDDMELDFRYSGDDDGGFYCFHVGLGSSVALASYSQEMRKLGDGDALGTDAAMSILREAVETANYTLDGLAELIAGLRAQAQSPA
jgi:hypothetical protein